ncbi:hypothetical protein V6N11_041870 [Hibiscus sabdariffa]|uniref:Uncharacterized protein n=2 Tax=Hibiscus sabdariffa TaxID=183260 RepID=A0ABR2BBE8_9ROSI
MEGGLIAAIVSKMVDGRKSWNLSQAQPPFGFTIEATETCGTYVISSIVLWSTSGPISLTQGSNQKSIVLPSPHSKPGSCVPVAKHERDHAKNEKPPDTR